MSLPYLWLLDNLARAPDATALVEDGGAPRFITWQQLSSLVAAARLGLRRHRIHPGDRVALAMDNTAETVAILVAIGAEGAIPVLLPPPRGRRDQAYLHRVRSIWADCHPVLLVEHGDDSLRRHRFAELGELPAATSHDLCADPPGRIDEAAVPAHQPPVFLQYTSGSTSNPRGVVVTADMVKAQCAQATEVYGDNSDDVTVTWVPLHHDMGLVTAVIRPLASGSTTVLLRPADFVAEPVRWPAAIDRYRGTQSSAPDFGYAHCVRRITTEQLDGLDLSCWRIARNAGEVVRPETLRSFTSLCSDVGFRPEAFCPSYGMAEATLTIAATTPDDPPRVVHVDPAALEAGRLVYRDDGRALLSSGSPLPGTTIRVAETGELLHTTPDVIGELVIEGPQVAHRYYTSDIRLHPTGGLATGDLGLLHAGHVFVLGRRDDVLSVNGRKVFQQDLVAAAHSVPGVRRGRVAAFVDELEPGQVAVVAERSGESSTDASDNGERTAISLRRCLAEQVGILVGPVLLVAAGELPVTTSGKVRVQAAKTLLARHLRDTRAMKETCQ